MSKENVCCVACREVDGRRVWEQAYVLICCILSDDDTDTARSRIELVARWLRLMSENFRYYYIHMQPSQPGSPNPKFIPSAHGRKL